MGTIWLLRHGQASFGSDDYDRLSELGAQQCRQFGRWLAARGGAGPRFDLVLHGTLKRHVQSLAALREGHAEAAAGPLPEALCWPGLDEYDSQALLRCVHPGPLAHPHDEATRRQHFRLLREAMLGWIAGRIEPAGMPSWRAFTAGVQGALDHVRQHSRGDALVVSSGGPISTAIALVMQAAPETVPQLNLRLRNCALSEIVFNERGFGLHSFNQLPHLEGLDPDRREAWHTYA